MGALQSLFTKLTSSQGFKRGVSVALFLAAQVPQLAPYQDVLNKVAMAFGITGLAHAALASK